MDRGQTGPVVRNGGRKDLVDATMLHLPFWRNIRQYKFTINLRLAGLLHGHPDDQHVRFQMKYARELTQIRTNGPFDEDGDVEVIEHFPLLGQSILRYKNYKYFTDEDEALAWLYPPNDNVMAPNTANKAILCSLNSNVDLWNAKVQALNPNLAVNLFSENEFVDVDDPYGHLKDMLTPASLAYYNKPGIPLHQLTLKVGDICFIMRNLYT